MFKRVTVNFNLQLCVSCSTLLHDMAHPQHCRILKMQRATQLLAPIPAWKDFESPVKQATKVPSANVVSDLINQSTTSSQHQHMSQPRFPTTALLTSHILRRLRLRHKRRHCRDSMRARDRERPSLDGALVDFSAVLFDGISYLAWDGCERAAEV